MVGARCAGEPTAMLLAHRGHPVLLVDRAASPATRCPPITFTSPAWPAWSAGACCPRSSPPARPGSAHSTLDVGTFALHAAPPPIGDVAAAYSLRRIVLDQILVRAAADAGVEVRPQFPVDELITDGDRVTGIRSRGVTEHARIVIGADGLNSLVARSVGAPKYNDQGTLTCAHSTYVEGILAPAR